MVGGQRARTPNQWGLTLPCGPKDPTTGEKLLLLWSMVPISFLFIAGLDAVIIIPAPEVPGG
jgi:hypothetical protein